jgi:soluble lytic murein transglycosylase-like protein
LASARQSEKLTDMRPRKLLLPLAASFALAAPTAASANFMHVVSPGETLTSVAAADGLSVDQLAAANGISPGTQLVAGSTLGIPPQSGAVITTSTTTSTTTSSTTTSTAGDGDEDSDDGVATATTTAAPASGGSYLVQPGDTLSAIAARAGMTIDSLAALNGLGPDSNLLSGTVLKLSGSTAVAATSASSASSQPVGTAAEGSSSGPPYPTPESVSASEVGSIAAANGVPPALADAIGWQESGFNNDLVSPADARGVMQILPGTWQWINSSLAPAPLSPSSAADNVRGGVLMLHSLLNATGGNEAMAAAGYYQGLPSVEQHGLYSDTQQYVNSVMSLAAHFGG